MSASIASISVRYSRSVTGTPADFSSWKKLTNMAARSDRTRVRSIAFGYKMPHRDTAAAFSHRSSAKAHRGRQGDECQVRVLNAERLAHRRRHGGHGDAAGSGDLEPLSAARIRHRRLSGALVRGHAGGQPLHRLRAV